MSQYNKHNQPISTADCNNACCNKLDAALEYLATPEGLIAVRNAMVPLVMVGGIMMIAIGSTWAHFLKPECGSSYDSARFSIYTDVFTGERILEGNACPGYDWSSQSTYNTAGQYDFRYALSSEPRIATTPFYVGMTNPVPGPIGVAMNGIPIYNPSTSEHKDAVKDQHVLFDQCGGFNAAHKDFTFNAPVTGYYHYLELPGVKALTAQTTTSTAASPSSETTATTTSTSPLSATSPAQTYCSPSYKWYNESHGKHSPIAGFMADGIPIYGPYSSKGVLPTDLDECGGHSSDDYSYYHYHFQLTYPYSVNCLKGCINGAMNAKLHTPTCAIDNTVSYDYSSLLTTSISYGGSGKNSTNITGPACLITFGILLVISSITCFSCLYCKRELDVDRFHAKLPMAANEEFGYVDNDNVL
jgi:hypothetical protein